jgi:hypothetical protein
MNVMKWVKMKKPVFLLFGLGTAILSNGIMPTSSAAAGDQVNIEPAAERILTGMSEYLGGLARFSADYDASTDVVLSQGQKIKLAHSGQFVVSRPDKLRIIRLGEFAQMDFALDGGQIFVYGQQINGYLQASASTIDEAIAFVRDDIGMEAPGADLLAVRPLDMTVTDITTGFHVGMTTVGGVAVHHLAFRGAEVDWQIWIKDGEEALPLKYVITSKLLAGAPEYSVLMTNWNTEPETGDTTFTFTPPAGAKQLTSIAVDEIGNANNGSE